MHEKVVDKKMVLSIQGGRTIAKIALEVHKKEGKVVFVLHRLNDMISHLPNGYAKRLKSIFFDSNVVPILPQKICTAAVSFWDDFELVDETLDCYVTQKMAPLLNKAVHTKQQNMFSERIITFASPTWLLSVIIAAKKGGTLRF